MPEYKEGDFSAFANSALDEGRALGLSLKEAPNTAPDVAAKHLRLKNQTGLPLEVVNRDAAAIEKAVAASRVDTAALREAAPGLSSWLAEHPTHASAAQDDMDTLKKVETHVKGASFGRGLWNALNAGAAKFDANVSRIPALIYDALSIPQNMLATQFNLPWLYSKSPDWLMNNPLAKHWDATEKHYQEQTPDLGADVIEAGRNGDYHQAAQALALQVVNNLPNQAFIIGSTLTGAGAALTLGSAGALTAADVNKRSQESGVAPETATTNALAQGTIEAVFEKFGTFGLLKHWEGALTKSVGKEGAKEILKDFAKTFASTTAGEANEEALTQIGQDFSDYVTGVNPQALTGTLQRAANAGLVGAASGGVMTAPSAIGAGVHRGRQLQQANQTRDFYLALGETAKESKLLQRLPEGFRDAVERMTKNGPVENVYLPVKEMETYFQQQGVNPVSMMQKLNALESYTQAKETGGDVRIPLADWATNVVGTPHYQGLAEDVKFSPEELTPRQAKELDAQLEAQAKAASEQKTGTVLPPAEQHAQLTSEVKDWLVKDGGVEPSLANEKAAIIAARYVQRAAVLPGTNPSEMFASERIRLQREGVTSVAPVAETQGKTFQQGETGQDYLARLWSGMAPEDRMNTFMRDRKTGILGQRAFQTMDRTGKQVANVGIEGMKFINDKVGHEAGDQLYRMAANAIQSVVPDAAKVGGDFEFLLEHPDQLAGILDAIRAQVPELAQIGNATVEGRGFDITGAVGQDSRTAAAAHAQLKADLEAAQQRAGRGAQPLRYAERQGVEATAPAQNAAPVPEALRTAFTQMADQEAFRQAFFDPQSGMLNDDGFHALPVRAAISHADVDHLGLTNKADGLGHEAGNTLLRAFEFAMRNTANLPEFQGKIDLAHISGDEYYAQADSADLLEAYWTTVEKKLTAPIDFVGPKGETYIKDGITFSAGIGGSHDTAERTLLANKQLPGRSAERADAGWQLAGNEGPQPGNVEGNQASGDNLRRRESGVARGNDNGRADAGLRGSQGQEGSRTLNQSALPGSNAPVWHSRLVQTISDKMPAAASTEQVLGLTKEISTDEKKWMGLDDFLKGKTKVDKAELLDFLAAHQPKIREVVKGYQRFDREARLEKEALEEIPRAQRTPAQQARIDELQEMADNELSPGVTKFAQYALPGGENYREVLFTLPEQMKLPAGWDVQQNARGTWTLMDSEGRYIGEWKTREQAISSQAQQTGASVFKSSHWDEPNVLAHVRLNDRIDADGKRVLFVEEIQSDWHQAGRKYGYAGESAIPKAVPDAPLRKTWHEFAFKRILRMATEQGYDRVAWTTGEQQAERYDLSKHIDRLSYGPTGLLEAFDKNGQKTFDKIIPEKSLEDVIGKEAAKKLLEQAPDEDGERHLGNADLKVGGEGMKGFYDKILVDYANKFGKKFGAKTSETKVDTGTKTYTVSDPDGNTIEDLDVYEADELLASHRGWTSTGGPATSSVHALDVTPALRDAALQQGFSLFQRSEGTPELLVQHNLSAANLRHAARMGGLAAPSLAVTKVGAPIDGFGEITLVAPASLADPKAGSQVYGADVYSPRYPKITYKFDIKTLRAAEKEWQPWIEKSKDKSYLFTGDSLGDGVSALENSNAVMSRFLDDRGIAYQLSGNDWEYRGQLRLAIENAGLQSEFADYAASVFDGLKPEEKIFKGFTNMGNRRYAPHTLDNVIKELKQNVRGGEGFNYGVGSLRAKFTPKFRSLAQIRKAKSRLMTSEDFAKVKEEVDAEFWKLAEKMKPYYQGGEGFGYGDAVINTLSDVPKMGMSGALDGIFTDVPVKIKQEIADYLNSLRDLPTEYFEAKLPRAVGINEFAAAVVPTGSSKETVKALEDAGVKVYTYKKGDIKARQQAIEKAATENQTLFQRGDDARGRIDFTPNGPIITLLKNADPSSLMHEMAHQWLEEMGRDVDQVRALDPASLTEAQQRFLADSQTTLEWLGAKDFKSLSRDQHEQWARGFEQYLRNGEAPSSALRTAFARFKAWLSFIYRTVKDLGVEVNPQIKGVFDRMLASQEEIGIAEDEQQMQPLFPDPASVGMTPEEAARYEAAHREARQAAEERLTARLMADVSREQTRLWNQTRAQVKAEIEAGFQEDPTYNALSILQRGKLVDGSVPNASWLEKLKLDKQAIVEGWGPGMLRALPRPYVYTEEGGIHPDQAAELLGFRSGDELLTAMRDAEPYRQMIERKTDEEMQVRHGDKLQEPMKLAEEAQAAVHNDKQAEVLRAELQHLASENLAKLKGLVRRVAKPIPTVAEVRRRAEQIMADKLVRDIRPVEHQRAEAKTAREAVDLLLKGDIAGAFEAKRRQLFNHELYRAAKNAKDEIDSAVEYMAGLSTPAARQRIGKAGADYLDQIDALSERYEFRRGVSLRELDKRKSLLDFVNEQEAAGRPVNVPEYVLDDARQVSYKEISLEELLGVRDLAKQVEYLAKTKNRLLADKQKRDFQAAKDEILTSISAYHDVTPAPKEYAKGWGDRILKGVKGFLAYHTRMEFFFNRLDGNKANGAAWSWFFEPMTKAEESESALMRRSVIALNEIFNNYTKAERALLGVKKIHIPEINNSMTKANLLAVALNTGNEYNRSALLEGESWDDTKLKAVLDRLDERDWKVVQGIWDHIDSFWPEISQLEKDIVGVAPAKVEATAVTNRFGQTLRGGYYPIVFDTEQSNRQARLEEAANVQEMFGGNWARAMTRHGHTKERVGTGGKPLLLDLTGMTRHLSNVVHDLAYRRAIIDVSRLVHDPDISATIQAVAGTEMQRQLNPWLLAIAGDRRNEPANPVERLLARARNGATVVNLGWKLSSALVQTTGYTLTINEVGPKYAALGLADTFGQPWKLRKAWEFISSRSPMMAERMSNYDRDIRDATQKLGVEGSSITDPYLHQVKQSFFYFTGFMDLATSVPTWMAAYRKAMDGKLENVEAGNEEGAVAYADSVVRETQSAGAAKDNARIQMGSESFKLFTAFYSQASLVFNQIEKARQQFKMDGNYARLLSAMALIWFIPAVLEQAIRGRGPSPDDDEEEWAQWLASQLVFYPLGSVVFLRDVGDTLQNYLERGRVEFSASPALDAVEQIVRGATVPLKPLRDKEITRADVKGAVMSVGYAFGLPTRQLWLTAEQVNDYMTGDDEGNPLEMAYRALLTGKKKPD